MFRQRIAVAVFAIMWLALTGAAKVPSSGDITVMIRGVDVEALAGPDSTIAQYYVVQYTLPQGVEAAQVERAVLELYVDVTAKTRGKYVNEAPLIEVFALTESPIGDVEIGQLDTATRASRPVARGESRHVRIDVTKIVRAHMAGGLENHGLAIGSLSGMREGDITLVEGVFPDGAVGTLRIYASDDIE